MPHSIRNYYYYYYYYHFFFFFFSFFFFFFFSSFFSFFFFSSSSSFFFFSFFFFFYFFFFSFSSSFFFFFFFCGITVQCGPSPPSQTSPNWLCFLTLFPVLNFSPSVCTQLHHLFFGRSPSHLLWGLLLNT